MSIPTQEIDIVKTDLIQEKTSGNGLVVDGYPIKDGIGGNFAWFSGNNTDEGFIPSQVRNIYIDNVQAAMTLTILTVSAELYPKIGTVVRIVVGTATLLKSVTVRADYLSTENIAVLGSAGYVDIYYTGGGAPNLASNWKVIAQSENLSCEKISSRRILSKRTISNFNDVYKSEMDSGGYVAGGLHGAGVSTYHRWKNRTTIVANDWSSICWADKLGMFVAVAKTGTGNRAAYSLDGETWTTSAPPDRTYESICYSIELGLFVAVSSDGAGSNVITSSNGTTWVSRTAPDQAWKSICWAPELRLFVAVASSGTGNRVMTSTNGTAWTSQVTPVDNDWSSVCWAPELGAFMAVSTTGTTDMAMRSFDGVNWSIVTTPSGSVWESVCWSSEIGAHIAVASSGTNLMMRSFNNGAGWSAVSSSAMNAICSWGDAIGFVAVGNAICRVGKSTSSADWLSSNIGSATYKCVAYSHTLKIVCALSTNGTASTLVNTFRPRLLSSGELDCTGTGAIGAQDTGGGVRARRVCTDGAPFILATYDSLFGGKSGGLLAGDSPIIASGLYRENGTWKHGIGSRSGTYVGVTGSNVMTATHFSVNIFQTTTSAIGDAAVSAFAPFYILGSGHAKMTTPTSLTTDPTLVLNTTAAMGTGQFAGIGVSEADVQKAGLFIYKIASVNSIGMLRLRSADAINQYLWVDDVDQLRIATALPTATTSGVIVGTQTSDVRKKQDIAPLEYGLSEVMKLNPVRFRFIAAPDKKEIGFIAQETLPIIPEVVGDRGGEEHFLVMEYVKLIPVLVKAIQEQQATIDKLTRRIDGAD